MMIMLISPFPNDALHAIVKGLDPFPRTGLKSTSLEAESPGLSVPILG
jgi:hypothetical protein